MKLLCSLIILLAISYALAVTDEQKAKLEKFSKPCREESGLSTEEAHKLRNDGEQVVDTPIMRKHALCMFKKLGLATESGDILVDKLRPLVGNVVGDGQVDAIMNKCVVKKATPEETVINFGNCIREAAPNFLPVN